MSTTQHTLNPDGSLTFTRPDGTRLTVGTARPRRRGPVAPPGLCRRCFAEEPPVLRPASRRGLCTDHLEG